MNIWVTGANGQLGNHMRLVSAKSSNQYLFTDIEEVDLTNEAAVWSFARHHDVDVIVNCAAYTNVDRAEEEESFADNINHVAVGYLAQAAKASDATLIHISTDYVFGGNKNNTPCAEEEPVNPTGAYGRTKLAGERAIQNSGCRHIIIRTAWLYSEYGKNFVKTMLEVTRTQPLRKVVFDQVGTPTYAGDLATTIYAIIESGAFREHPGLYHFSNEGVCSWYDFTKEIARQAGNLQCDIQPCHSNEFPSKVIRPSFSVLDKTKIKNTFNISIPYWTDSLNVCIKNLLS